MDQRFSQGSNAFDAGCEKENRRLGAVFLLFGVVCTWAIWYYGPRGGVFNDGTKQAITILGAPILLVVGLANVISPPKAAYKAQVNHRRNGVYCLIGLVLGAVQLYFYHDIYGVW